MKKNRLSELTESMFYVLMAFLDHDLDVIGVEEFIKEKTRERVKLGPATLYTIIEKFQEEEMIRQEDTEEDKQIYSITENGRIFFDKEMQRIHNKIIDGEYESII